MCIFVLCDHKSRKAPQEDLVLVEIWLLIVAVNTPILMTLAWLVDTICILTSQIPSYMPNGDIPKKVPQVQSALFPLLETCHWILELTFHWYQFHFLISMKSAPNTVIQLHLESHWPRLHNWLTLKLCNHFLFRKFDPEHQSVNISMKSQPL